MAYPVLDHDVLVDPVSHEAVDPAQPVFKSFYAGRTFHFVSRENKAVFDDGPQLWIPTPHASVTSAAIDPLDTD